ncbi:molybdate ABC transporter substrate-binding protein [Leucobacter sp. HY1908]
MPLPSTKPHPFTNQQHRRSGRRSALAAVVAVLAMGLVGCSSVSDTAEEGTVTLNVSAAASLQRSFDEIAQQFEEQHPGVKVTLSYDGSSTLATQIVEGAPVDVFASADERNMQVVVDEALASDPQVFATNTLVIAVPAGNPAKVTGLKDLQDAVTVLCAPEVPCGGASETLLKNAAVKVTPASLEQNVTAVLAKVAAGEADAGLVYRTDVVGDDAVESIDPEGTQDVVNRYPIAALTPAAQSRDAKASSGANTSDAKHAAAREFVAYVLGKDGQGVLERHGFGSAL